MATTDRKKSFQSGKNYILDLKKEVFWVFPDVMMTWFVQGFYILRMVDFVV